MTLILPMITNNGNSRRLMTVEEILSSLADIDGRNYLFSRNSIASGKMTNTDLDKTFSDNTGGTYRYDTSPSGTLTFTEEDSSTYILGQSITNYITILTVNLNGSGVADPTVEVNGTPYSGTRIGDDSNVNKTYINLYVVPIGLQDVTSVYAEYIKSSQNDGNVQPLYIIPGKWALVSETDWSSGSRNFSVLSNDLIFNLGKQERDVNNYFNNFTGVSNTLIMHTSAKWYSGTAQALHIINANGTFTVYPDNYNLGDGAVYDDVMTCILRFEEA